MSLSDLMAGVVLPLILLGCAVLCFMGKFSLEGRGMNGLPIATNKEKKKPYFKERSMGLGCFFVLFAAFPPLMVYAQYHNEPWIGTVLLGLLILLILYIVVFTVVFTKLMKRRKKP